MLNKYLSLCQVNEGTKWMAEILFSFDVCLSVCLSVCLCVCVQRTGQSDQFKTVKATDTHVPRDSPDMNP